MKKSSIHGKAQSAICVLGAVLFGGAAYAAEYTYAWKTDEYPTSLHDGKITITYSTRDATKIKTLTINSAAGDRFVFTGDKMFFTDHNNDTTAVITNKTSGTLVFQNDVQIRSANLSGPRGSHTWRGYNTFVGTDDYTTILANADLEDYEPTESLQDSNDETGKSIGYWNSKNTMFPHQIVREPGRIAFQYQTVMDDLNGRKRVKVIKAELKQIGEDIKMRILGAYSVYSDASAPVGRGFDIDTLWDGTETVEIPVRTTGNLNNGYGINTVALSHLGATFIVRFEGRVKFTGSPNAAYSTRFEVADITKFDNSANAYIALTGGSIMACDGSVSGLKWASSNNGGYGTIAFVTTKPTSSPAVTNLISITGNWRTKSSFLVKGIDGYPMVLRVDATTALPTNSTINSYLYNGKVRVAPGGILKLKASGIKGVGLKNGACDFIVEKGGILQQAAEHVFGLTSMVSLDGGKLQLSVDEPYAWDTASDIPLLTLRNGAIIDNVSTNQSKSLRIGRSVPGATWYVSGDTPSTNTVAMQFYGPENTIVTNTFNVAKLGDFDADFVCTKGIGMYSGDSPQYRTNVLRKVGLGTMLVNGLCTVPADNLIEGGTFKLGASNIWRGYFESMVSPTNPGYRADDPPPPIVLCGGTFAAAANTSNGLGRVTLTADSGLALDEGACFTCYDQSSVAWNDNARLTVTIPTNSVGALLGSIRFGTDANGLTESQQKSIRLNGMRAKLDNAGWLKIRQIGTHIFMR